MEEESRNSLSNFSNRRHRRKNQQIIKPFQCTQKCGKFYGSYPALFTHMKQKHGKIPKMNNNIYRNNKKDYCQIKQPEEKMQDYDQNCKICRQSPCQCIQKYNSSQKQNILEIISSQNFINLVNQVGSILKNGQNVFIRESQQTCQKYNKEKIIQMLQQFNKIFNQNVLISNQMIKYLSFSSQYWAKQNVKELYNGIFAIKKYRSIRDMNIFLRNHQQSFPNLIKSTQYENSMQFQAFIIAVNNI